MRKVARVLVAPLVAIATLVPAAAAHAAISGTSGQVTEISPPAAVVATSRVEHDDLRVGRATGRDARLAAGGRHLDDRHVHRRLAASRPARSRRAPWSTATSSTFRPRARLAHRSPEPDVPDRRPRHRGDPPGASMTSNVLGAPGTDYTTPNNGNDLELDPAQDTVILPDLRTVTIRAGDDRHRASTRSASSRTHDSPPTANAGGPYSGVEGSAVTLHGDRVRSRERPAHDLVVVQHDRIARHGLHTDRHDHADAEHHLQRQRARRPRRCR